ncbi:S-adenosyl-L-methionine-dependent methyltransferase [Aspergillus alliaceus]|uniref:Sterol 24-C-methyltransferase n=1 Tax=Petromyces alliaceus TaxID=209559 RepID=A0A5N7CBZ0_PETAA|nr:S-adenosyl-L-methionine-dependent methyltransferase [Aspergillus alliaceus]
MLQNKECEASKTGLLENPLPEKDASDTNSAEEYYGKSNGVVNRLWGTSLHVCRRLPEEALREAMVRHEHYLALRLNLQPGHEVLDLGCGIGGPTREIARFSEANICGINISPSQINAAEELTKRADLSHKVRYVVGDFTYMNLEDASFDRAYSIEATCYAPNLSDAYSEAFRVLRPGGIFAVYEVVLTENYDPENPEHINYRKRMECVAGHPHLVTASTAMAAMQEVGFVLQAAEDLANTPGYLPWYSAIDGSFKWAGGVLDTVSSTFLTLFLRSFSSKGILYQLVRCAEKLGILHPGTHSLGAEMVRAVEAYRIAGEKGLVTPMFLMVGRKPRV